jgi:hypothetical protein
MLLITCELCISLHFTLCQKAATKYELVLRTVSHFQQLSKSDENEVRVRWMTLLFLIREQEV